MPSPFRLLVAALAAAAAALLAVPSAGARPGEFVVSGEAARAAIDGVVSGQLAAFRREDFTAARALAAAPLRDKFPPAEYERMVRRGYPRVVRHASARLGEVRDDGERALAVVVLADPDGTEAAYRWLLAREPEGWRVLGVAEIAAPAGGA